MGKEFGFCSGDNDICESDALDWDVAGKFVVYLLVIAPVWFSIRIIFEWGIAGRINKYLRLKAKAPKPVTLSSDKDVEEEVRTIHEHFANSGDNEAKTKYHIALFDLRRTFYKVKICPGRCCGADRGKRCPAVQGINVGVTGGECFGLLGVNGAGKTTAMRMITSEIEADSGDVFVCGWSASANRSKARKHLGYCPQFDAIPAKLTVRETLSVYAALRGVPIREVKAVCDQMITQMCLEAHQHQRCERLSGGNRRKLSTALAMLGGPDVILLDEPSTGIDVGARRFLWDILGRLRLQGHALLLTSHSMEECEVLCTRLTIMSHGVLQCLGSPLQLKNLYGDGYTLSLKAPPVGNDEEDPCIQIHQYMTVEVPSAQLLDRSAGSMRYRIRNGSGKRNDGMVPLSQVFRRFESATAQGGELYRTVSDYMIAQTSLEDVFLHFAIASESSHTPICLPVEIGKGL